MNDDLQVFIFGCARSGTSATYYALREVLRLPGAGESHVFPIFQRMIHQFRLYHRDFAENHPNDLAASLDIPELRRHLVNYIRLFYSGMYHNNTWIDKTPGAEAILGIPLVREAYPRSKIIITRRTGVEVVQSFRSKFQSSFESACLAWQQSAAAILRTRDLHANLLEIDQFDMWNDPGEVGRALARHLDAPNEAPAFAKFFGTRRIDQLSTHDWSGRLTVANSDWTSAEKLVFYDICGDLMKRLGYPL